MGESVCVYKDKFLNFASLCAGQKSSLWLNLRLFSLRYEALYSQSIVSVLR